MQLKRFERNLLLLTVLASLLGGCAEEDMDAIVDVRWTIGGTTCNRAGVDRVIVSLVRDSRSVASTEASCEAGEASVAGLAMGTYTVQVFAYRLGNETPAFVGQEAGIEVPKGGRVKTPVIFLQEAPGAVDLTWRFESGKICSFEGAEWVRVSAFDERNRVVVDMEVPCDPGVDISEGLAGPGTEYLANAGGVVLEYLFSGPHEVIVLAYPSGGDTEAVWGGSGTAEVRSFELTPLDIVLSACTDDPESVCF